MEIKEMTLSDVEARLAELDVEVRESSEVETVEALTEEMKSLEERKAELIALEERRATAEAIQKGNATVNIVDKREEEKTMEERKFTVDSVEYRDAYLKSLMGKTLDVEERDALTAANKVIPTETLNQIYGLLDQNQLLAEVNALHIPGYVSVPKATAVADASWKAIDAASVDSADTVTAVALTAKKLIKTIEITADIQAMAIPAFQTWLVSKLAEKMEAAICAAILNGNKGQNEPEGITTVLTAISGVTTVTVKNLGKIMSSVNGAYHSGAVFVMAPEVFYGDVLELANDSNGVVVANGIDQRIFGHKVVLDSNAGKNIIFGNINKGYVFNYGEGVSITSDQSVAFRSGSTVYRAMALCDGAVVDEGAFAMATLA